MREGLRRAGLRDRQARQPLRRGRGRDAAGSLREGAEDRPDLGLRRHHRLQPPARRRRGRQDQRQQALRRSGDRAGHHAGRPRRLRQQGQRAPAGSAGEPGHELARLQARRRRHAAAVGRQRRHRRRDQGGDEAGADRAADAGPAVRVEGRPLRQEQRDRLLQGRHDLRRRRRPDEPPGLGPHRLDQGQGRGPEPGRHGRGQRRLLPVP